MKAYTYIDKGHFDLLEKPTPLITHRYSLEEIEKAYNVFENREEGAIKIAEMGNTDADQVKLHFEVRSQGKPLDPMKYLPAR